MKKKILILIDNLRIGGGAARFGSILAMELSNKYEIILLTVHDFRDIYPFKGKHISLKENIGLYRKILKFTKINTFIRPIRIYLIIKSFSPDLFITITTSSSFFAIITKFIFQIKIPLIISVRTNPNMIYEKHQRYSKFLIKLLFNLKLVNKIIPNSKEIEKILEKDCKINKNKIKTIYSGVKLQEIKELKKEKILEYEEIFDNNNWIKFITVGRLYEHKGHKFLIEAFSNVNKVITQSKLIIIGDGPLRNDLEMLIKKKTLENSIILLSKKKNPFKYISKSDIFVFSSLFEGLPMVLIEALACGIPIVSTNCQTGPKEILDNGQYGFLVNIMDVKDLSDKMILLAKNPTLLKEYSKKSLIRSNFFKFEKSLNEWINLIEIF